MKIGKTVKVVTSPKRQIRKATKKKEQAPIPVKIPEKVESFKFSGHYGMGVYRPVAYIANVTS